MMVAGGDDLKTEKGKMLLGPVHLTKIRVTTVLSFDKIKRLLH